MMGRRCGAIVFTVGIGENSTLVRRLICYRLRWMGVTLDVEANGRDGPGGWWILDEPEVHFIRNVELTVPNLAGWRRERMPALPTS